jgi:hypothetical protein
VSVPARGTTRPGPLARGSSGRSDGTGPAPRCASVTRRVRDCCARRDAARCALVRSVRWTQLLITAMDRASGWVRSARRAPAGLGSFSRAALGPLAPCWVGSLGSFRAGSTIEERTRGRVSGSNCQGAGNIPGPSSRPGRRAPRTALTNRTLTHESHRGGRPDRIRSTRPTFRQRRLRLPRQAINRPASAARGRSPGCRPPPGACPRASGACGGSGGQRRTCGGWRAGSPRSRARKPAPA